MRWTCRLQLVGHGAGRPVASFMIGAALLCRPTLFGFSHIASKPVHAAERQNNSLGLHRRVIAAG
jgi:hypothetical protein